MKLLYLFLGLVLGAASTLQAGTVINIHLDSDEELANFSFLNSGQTIVFSQMDCNPTMKLEFPDKADDFYDLIYSREGEPYHKSIWLDKGEIDVYVRVANGKIDIYKVIGSSIYPKVINYRRGLGAIDIDDESGLKTYLRSSLKKFENSQFSLSIAATYLYHFEKDLKEVKWLNDYMQSKPHSYRTHVLYRMVDGRLSSILKEKMVLISEYLFLDSENRMIKVPPFKENEMIVLDFWFANCTPCRKQHEQIKTDMDNDALNKNIRIIGISIDEDLEKWSDYLSTNELTWENYKIFYQKGLRTVDKDLFITGFPTYVLLSSEGVILQHFNSYKEVKRYLNQ